MKVKRAVWPFDVLDQLKYASNTGNEFVYNFFTNVSIIPAGHP